MVSQSVVVCLALLAAASATNVQQCPGRSVENLSSNVELPGCKKLPCRLKKGTDQHISINFTPEDDTKDVINRVSAEVLSLPLPFPGVDGYSICDKLYAVSGEKATCPLKAGTTYTYKDKFPIHTLYPTLKTIVKWEIQDKKEKSLVCFNVPARIVE